MGGRVDRGRDAGPVAMDVIATVVLSNAATLIAVIGSAWAYTLRLERRLTRIEAKVDHALYTKP